MDERIAEARRDMARALRHLNEGVANLGDSPGLVELDYVADLLNEVKEARRKLGRFLNLKKLVKQ